jgi:hypothetical protein
LGKLPCKQTKTKSLKGSAWWNNGIKNKFCKEQPLGYTKGQLVTENVINGIKKRTQKLYKKVCCLETKQIFNSLKEAQAFLYETKKIRHGIKDVIKRHNELGSFHWAYYNDKTDMEQLLHDYRTEKNYVINKNTNEVFKSIAQASIKHKINRAKLKRACLDKNNNEWAYYGK